MLFGFFAAAGVVYRAVAIPAAVAALRMYYEGSFMSFYSRVLRLSTIIAKIAELCLSATDTPHHDA